jgi:hypothetical protein
MRRAWIIFAAISVGCAAPAPGPTSPAPVVITPVALAPPNGRVLEYGTLAPIVGAVVSFYDFEAWFTAGASKDPIASVVTNATGGYHVDLPPLRYRVAVDGVGVADMMLRPDTPHGDFIARPLNCLVTYGFVTDAATGAPLAGGLVSASGRQATTTSRGWYVIDFGCNQPSRGGTVVMAFTRDGYQRRQTIFHAGRIDAGLMPQ